MKRDNNRSQRSQRNSFSSHGSNSIKMSGPMLSIGPTNLAISKSPLGLSKSASVDRQSAPGPGFIIPQSSGNNNNGGITGSPFVTPARTPGLQVNKHPFFLLFLLLLLLLLFLLFLLLSRTTLSSPLNSSSSSFSLNTSASSSLKHPLPLSA